MNFNENILNTSCINEIDLFISNLTFSNCIFENGNYNFQKRIPVSISINKPKYLALENTDIKNISFDYNKFLSIINNDKDLLDALFQYKFDLEIAGEEFSLCSEDVVYVLNSVAYKCNKYISVDVLNKIWQFIEEKEILFYSDLSFIDESVRKYIYVLLYSSSFKENYYYSKHLDGFLLYKHMDIEHIPSLVQHYLIENHKTLLSYKEVLKLIPFKYLEIKMLCLESMKNKNQFIVNENYYIFLNLIYIYEDEINNSFSKLKEDQYSVLKYRICENLTLAETGNIMSKTRERIRQIEDKAYQVSSFYLPRIFIIDLKKHLEQYKFFPLKYLPIQNSEYKTIIISILQTKFNLIIDQITNNFVFSKELTYPKCLDNIIERCKKEEEILLTKDELIKFIKDISIHIKPQVLIDKMIELHDVTIIENQYFFPKLYKRKRDMIELIYRLRKDGYTNKEFDLFKEQIETYFPSEFDDITPRSVTALALYTNKIILYDWGRYIHINHIKSLIEEFDFSDVIDYLNMELEKVEQIDLQYYFDTNKDLLEEYGIISKYALHSLLKLKFSDDFKFQDAPWISAEGTQRTELRETLYSIMNENKVYTLQELMSMLRTHENRVRQLVERTTNIISIDYVKYMRKDFINFPESLLSEIILYVDEIVEMKGFIYINLVIEKFRIELNKFANYNREVLLLDLLRKTDLKKSFNVSNTRLFSKSYPVNRLSLNFHFIIEKYLFVNRNEISRNEIFEYFYSRGLPRNLIMHYYLNSKYSSIIRKNSDIFIKKQELSLSEKDIEDFNLLIMENIEGEENIDDFLIKIRNLLPKINLDWNSYIFCDLLNFNLFEFYPTKEEPIYIKLKKDNTLVTELINNIE